MILANKNKSELAESGYSIINNITDRNEAKQLVQQFGSLVNQYNECKEYDVRYTSGFDNYQYTKSMNLITPHTEAPDFDPPPQYLALYCINQANCGGGQTLLCNFSHLFRHLPTKSQQYLLQQPVNFLGGNPSPSEKKNNSYTGCCFSEKENGVCRFSHNYFTYGNVHGYALDRKKGLPAPPIPCPTKAAIAEEVSHLFSELASPILISEGSLLIWNNHRMLHARNQYTDKARHLVRFWVN